MRADSDLRDNVSPGWKFNHWELKGVPIRLELGPKDLEKGQVLAVLRFSKEKRTLPLDDALPGAIEALLDEIQFQMYKK